ncbi:MAG: tetratricopeptide repeat protein [Cyanobacteria bacterium J06649_4]
MRINLLLALTLSSISIATVTQAQDYQAPNQQAAQLTAQRPIRRIPGQLRPIPQLREPRNVSPELLGRQAMRDGNYRLAESKFREVLQDGHAESYRIYTYLGLSIYNQAIGNEIVLGRDYHRLPPPHIGGAISAFTEALKLEPTHNEALEGLAKSYEYRADSVFEQSLEKAIADYQLAKETLGEITPRFVRVSDSRRLSSVESLERSITSKLARAYVKRGDRQETRNLEGALQDYQLAFDSLGLRPAVRSIEFCSKFRAWNLNTSPSRRRRASTIFVPPNLNANPSRSRRLATNSTLITEIRNKLAKALTLRGDRSNASADYCEAIRINSEYAPAYFKLGHIFSEQGNQSEAIVKYQEAIDANNQYLEAYVALAGAFEMQNEHDKADETYVRLFKIAPDTADIESKLPREQLEALAAYFYRQLRVDSNNAHHHYYHLGRISSWQEDFEGAIENYEKSLSITDSGRIIFKNRRYDAYRLRGLALSAQGKYQQAIESLETAIRRRPDDATGHYDLGKVLVKQGTDLHRARASYRKAIPKRKLCRSLQCSRSAMGYEQHQGR